MNRNDLRRVDLNLLIVFETLMHERSVTRAAEKLFLGQPAISAALSRLRGLFDDPLFVRTGRSMEPSARAVEIFALLSPALDSISTAVSRAAEFDPATSTAVFRIGLSDDVEFALLPQLLKRLRAEAPGIVLVVRRVNYILMPEPAGLRGNLHRRQLHRRPAGQRQAQGAAPQPAQTAACRQRARFPEPGRLLRPPPCPGVVCWRPERVYR
jgi:hypothetical protein